MKIAVIGAGIIGVTTAYELACDGHEVCIFERRSAAAEEASFANAGVITPGYVIPWAAPAIAAQIMLQFFSRHPSFRVGFPMTLADLSWLWKFSRACVPKTYAQTRARMQELALYSQGQLTNLQEALQVEYDHTHGFLILFRSEKERKIIEPTLETLKEAGITYRELTPDDARKLEPALNPDSSLHSAIHLPDDIVGNCRQFAILLKNEAQRLGAIFNFNHVVASIDLQHGPSLQILNEAHTRIFDGVIVCAGVDSARLLSPLGIRVPLAPVYGYSLSASIREPLNAPRSAILDEQHQVAISRLGNRVRVSGGSEIGGLADRKKASTLKTLYKVLQDWFPGACVLSNSVQVWKGARPMLPDGRPLLGASGIPGVWLNFGHGSSGWSLACGSARVTADMVAGKTAEIDLDGFGLARFKS